MPLVSFSPSLIHRSLLEREGTVPQHLGWKEEGNGGGKEEENSTALLKAEGYSWSLEVWPPKLLRHRGRPGFSLVVDSF